MSDGSKIEWTDASWNCVTGCTKISAGCDHCYAETFAERWRGVPGHHFEQGFDVTLRPERLDQPLRWKRSRRIFVNSMSDLFHEAVPDEFIACMFTVMARTPQHAYQILTKRHGRMRSPLSSPEFRVLCFAAAASRGWDLEGTAWPLPNVWLGVSVEDQKWANIRIPALLDTPAVVRFLSCEPLLGGLNLWHWINPSDPCVDCDVCGEERFVDEIGWGHESYVYDDEGREVCNEHGDPAVKWCDGPSAGILPRRIDWVIVGGESGPGARPMDLEWAREIAMHCRDARAPLFVKQLGAAAGRTLGAGPKGGDWDAWPEDLRLREFPVAAEAVAS